MFAVILSLSVIHKYTNTQTMGIQVQWQLWFYLLYGVGCRLLRQNATRFLLDDLYRNPGPVQFDGPGADAKAVTLCVEDRDYMGRIKELQKYLDEVLKSCYFFVLYVLIYVCVRACARARNIFQIFIFYLSFMMCVLMQLWIPLSVSLFFFFFQFISQVRTIVKPGCSQEVLKAALSVMASVTEVLSAISASGGQTTL